MKKAGKMLEKERGLWLVKVEEIRGLTVIPIIPTGLKIVIIKTAGCSETP